MNRSIDFKATKRVTGFSLLIIAFTAIGSTCCAEEHQGVTPQGGSVPQNNKIDSAQEDAANPEEVSFAGGMIRIVSKTFTPPAGHQFLPYSGAPVTHVDIHDDPAVHGEKIKDSPTEIKIAGTFVYDTAAEFPLRGEGNLSVVVTGGSGGGGTPPVPVFHWAAKTQKLKVNLVIHHGQGGAAVPEDTEESVGAFTVANLNDTDGNGTIDRDQNPIPGEPGEVDLMEINLLKPIPDLGGEVTFSPLGGNIKVWDSSTKGTEVTIPHQYPTNELPKTLWVEARAVSTALRDIGLQLEYKGAKDVVKATGIWATQTGFKNKLTDALWADAQAPLTGTFAFFSGGKFGLQIAAPPVGVVNTMGIEFTLTPPGVGSEPGVAIDITRQIEDGVWVLNNGNVVSRRLKTFPGGDIANDDFEAADDNDEDVAPPNNKIYAIDGPGVPVMVAPFQEFIHRLNAREFVRIRVDGTRPGGERLAGSRASEKSLWYSRIGVIRDDNNGGFFMRNPVRPNDIELGQIIVGGAP